MHYIIQCIICTLNKGPLNLQTISDSVGWANPRKVEKVRVGRRMHQPGQIELV